MTAYEMQEVMRYPEIYYVGDNVERGLNATKEKGSHNNGHDDSRGDYLVINNDHVSFLPPSPFNIGRGRRAFSNR